MKNLHEITSTIVNLNKINDLNDITIRTMEEKEEGILEELVQF